MNHGCRTIVAGGGIIGCPTACSGRSYERIVMLLAKGSLTSGTVLHTAGLAVQLPGRPLPTPSNTGLEFKKQLQKQAPVETSITLL